MPFPARQKASSYGADAQKAAAFIKKQDKAPIITQKQKTAIEAMAFKGLERTDAAIAAGMTDESLRKALKKPAALAYLNECNEVLRTSLRPRALHKMGELLDAKNESTQVKAAEYLDGLNRGSHTVGATTVNVNVNQSVRLEKPGYVIDLRPEDDDPQQIEAESTDYGDDDQ